MCSRYGYLVEVAMCRLFASKREIEKRFCFTQRNTLHRRRRNFEENSSVKRTDSSTEICCGDELNGTYAHSLLNSLIPPGGKQTRVGSVENFFRFSVANN